MNPPADNHSFNVAVATTLAQNKTAAAVEKAILLKEFYNLCSWRSAQNKTWAGVGWWYASAKNMADKFPYMNPKNIARWVVDLIDTGFMYAHNLNKKKYDQTKSYTVNFEAYQQLVLGNISISQNEKWISQIKQWISQNEEWISQNEQPIHSLNNSKDNSRESVAGVNAAPPAPEKTEEGKEEPQSTPLNTETEKEKNCAKKEKGAALSFWEFTMEGDGIPYQILPIAAQREIFEAYLKHNGLSEAGATLSDFVSVMDEEPNPAEQNRRSLLASEKHQPALELQQTGLDLPSVKWGDTPAALISPLSDYFTQRRANGYKIGNIAVQAACGVVVRVISVLSEHVKIKSKEKAVEVLLAVVQDATMNGWGLGERFLIDKGVQYVTERKGFGKEQKQYSTAGQGGKSLADIHKDSSDLANAYNKF